MVEIQNKIIFPTSRMRISLPKHVQTVPMHCQFLYKSHIIKRSTISVTQVIILSVHTYSITVESVEDPRYITAQDTNRDACVVQRQPATASLLGSVAREQVIPHRTQHAHLGGNHTVSLQTGLLLEIIYV